MRSIAFGSKAFSFESFGLALFCSGGLDKICAIQIHPIPPSCATIPLMFGKTLPSEHQNELDELNRLLQLTTLELVRAHERIAQLETELEFRNNQEIQQ